MKDMKYGKRSDVVVQEVEGEFLLLDMKDNKLHQLNRSASMLWEAMDGSRSARELAAVLTEAFEIDEDQALRDVSGTLETLREAGLVEVEDPVDRSASGFEAEDERD